MIEDFTFLANYAPPLGYLEAVSDRAAILFSVPSPEWRKLQESKEWKDFQALFEKCQEADIQKQLQAEECRRESKDCTETSNQQVQSCVDMRNGLRILDTLRALIPFHRKRF